MIVSSGPSNSTPIFGIEAGLTLIPVAAAFPLPRFGSPISLRAAVSLASAAL
jgi:hypothetical protein